MPEKISKPRERGGSRRNPRLKYRDLKVKVGYKVLCLLPEYSKVVTTTSREYYSVRICFDSSAPSLSFCVSCSFCSMSGPKAVVPWGTTPNNPFFSSL